MDEDEFNISIEPPVTLASIDLPNYLGRWYQMYANLFVFSTFERDNECVTADYGLNLNGSISVENNARLGGPGSNKTDVINGYAFIPDPKDPAKILVNFPSVPGPAGEYWITKIGPKEETFPNTPLYQYAVVTDSGRVSLFVLARDPEDFNARFKDEVLQYLDNDGFTKVLNRPVETVHNSECRYAGVNYE